MLYSYLFLFAKGDFTLHSKHRHSSTSSSILHLSIAQLVCTLPQHCPSIPFSALALQNCSALFRSIVLRYLSMPLQKPSISALFLSCANHFNTLLYSSITEHNGTVPYSAIALLCPTIVCYAFPTFLYFTFTLHCFA